jgi:oxygen-independent coproporphyrinogen-3 oxidase
MASRSHSAPVFDPDLVARYDVSGPRYTSYPAAPHFHANFGEADFRRAAAASNATHRPLSIYVHVPFCLSPCFYCGCTRLITRDRKRADPYLDRLFAEIDRVAPLFDSSRQVEQLHFGGGTPNFFDEPHMAKLLDRLAARFAFSNDENREFGIEIDPRWCPPEYVAMLARHGFNRISVGIQDFDPAVQEAVNRIQSVEQTRDVLQAARANGFRSASVDLIYGLPKQTIDGFAATLDRVVEIAPDRIACYAYAHLPERFKAQRQIVAADLPNAATRLELLGLTIEKLTAAGYVYIGMDHFARPDDELALAQRNGTLQRNFQGYSTHGDCDLIGFGMSAISHVGNTFSQNARDLPVYYGSIDAGRVPVVRGLALDDDDVIRGDAIQQLMCHGTLDLAAFEKRHHLHFAEYFRHELDALERLAADGLVALSRRRIDILPRGRFLLRNIAMCFDARLGGNADSATRYSKAV